MKRGGAAGRSSMLAASPQQDPDPGPGTTRGISKVAVHAPKQQGPLPLRRRSEPSLLKTALRRSFMTKMLWLGRRDEVEEVPTGGNEVICDDVGPQTHCTARVPDGPLPAIRTSAGHQDRELCSAFCRVRAATL